MTRNYKCLNIKPQTDEKLKEICAFLEIPKVQLMRDYIESLHELFLSFKPREGMKLNYDIAVLGGQLIVDFWGLPRTFQFGTMPVGKEQTEEVVDKSLKKKIESEFNREKEVEEN